MTGRGLVLFDLDGTLVDSAPGIWASVHAATPADVPPGVERLLAGAPR